MLRLEKAAIPALANGEHLLENLNPEQCEVVTHFQGPLLVAAVAGAGKTTAVVHRIAYLVQNHGVDPSRILAVTFSKRGAEEMNTRLAPLLPAGLVAEVGTFHAIANRVRMRDLTETSSWKLDDARYRTCVKKAIAYDRLNIEDFDVDRALHFFSMCKGELLAPGEEETEKFLESLCGWGAETMHRVFEETETIRKEEQFITFDDMLTDTVRAMRDDDGLRSVVAGRYDFVIQDEAQDQNYAQLLFGALLAKKHRNYMIVGDPAQTIYAWRGAHPQKLLGFAKTWDARVIQMHRNYRCGTEIADIANKVLANMERETKLNMTILAERKTPAKIVTHSCADPEDEAAAVLEYVRDLHESGVAYRDMCILYRTGAQSRAPEEAFLRAKIPYHIWQGINFYHRKEVKDILSYLVVAQNDGTSKDVERTLLAPYRYIKKEFLASFTRKPGEHWYSAVREKAWSTSVLKENPRAAVLRWTTLMEDLHRTITLADQARLIPADPSKYTQEAERIDALRNGRPDKLIRKILASTNYMQWLRKSEGEDSVENNRTLNVDEFQRVAGSFATVKDLLDFVALMQNKSLSMAKNPQAVKGVSLSTIHGAKGLEWKHVFIIGAAEGLLPHKKAPLSEERRLFYVGVTRARDCLYVSWPNEMTPSWQLEPSSFLYETELLRR